MSRRATLAVAVVGAVAFVCATVWINLVTAYVVVPEPPASADGEDSLRAYWVWFAGTVPALHLGQIALLVALAGSAMVVGCSADTLTGASRVAARAVVAGLLFWGIASCIRLGSDRAVGMLAVHDNPIDPTNSIHFALSWVASAFELVGSLAAGAGLVTVAIAARRLRILGVAAGLALAALGICLYLPVEDGPLFLRIGVGAVLLPAWLVADAVVGRPSAAPDTRDPCRTAAA